jgi:hypothetical protein
MHDFTNQDLRNSSFKGRELQGADFSGSDIRGCDFSHTQLQGADFERIKAGREPTKLIRLMLVAAVTCLVSFHAYSQMIFGVVGLIPEDPAWVYTYPLHVSLAIAAVGAVVRGICSRKPLFKFIAATISGAASGALLGFFYLGSMAGKNSQMAGSGSVVGAVIVALLFLWQKKGWMKVAIASLGAVAAYGLTFLFVARAIAYLSVNQLVGGIFWGILSLLSMAATIVSLQLGLQQVEARSTTSFRGADLTDASFAGARLGNADFTGAIGFRR